MDRIDIITEIQTTIENSGKVTRQDIDKFSEQPICIGDTEGLWWHVVTVAERFVHLEAYKESEGGSLDFDVVCATSIVGFNAVNTFELELILKVVKAKYERKTPTSKLNHDQLASKITLLKEGEEFNFSENEDGSDYWGAKVINVFDTLVVIVGYYGGTPELVVGYSTGEVYERVLDGLGNFFKQEFLYTFGKEVYVCAECGSEDVEHKIWAEINNHNNCSDEFEGKEKADRYCNHCCKHVDFKKVEK